MSGRCLSVHYHWSTEQALSAGAAGRCRPAGLARVQPIGSEHLFDGVIE
jgi:hypothetical protein